MTPDEARRLALDDSLCATPRHHTVVVGCGNLLRGDDAVGPILIRHLWEDGVGDRDGVTLVDGGTAGMDVAFKMRGARQVILIDASSTGAAPGTIYRVPGAEVEQLPPLEGLHSHQFRWDHALAFARWLLADEYPDDIVVFLIEVAGTEPGAPLSAPVDRARVEVMDLVRELIDDGPGDDRHDHDRVEVWFTEFGDLRLGADVASRFFPGDALAALRRDDQLWLYPLVGPQGGGLLLKQRTAAGERSALVAEALGEARPVGRREAVWNEEGGVLQIDLGTVDRGPADKPVPTPANEPENR